MISFSRFEHDYDKSYFNFVEPLSDDFRVFIGDREVPVYTCRISAYPLNRVWTGYQRPGNQTEVVSFVNIVSDEPVPLTITTSVPHERLLLKPYSREIHPLEEDGVISFTLPDAGSFVLEPDDYHHCLYIFNSRPVPCPDPSSVTHYFGPGIHMPGKIVLHDNESVYVDKDALVFGCIFAENANNLHIFGNGVLDDMGEGRINKHCYESYTVGNMKFYDCRNLRVEGVLLRDSAIWCINLFHCFDVDVRNVKIFGQWRYNTDGVDIVNCQDIVIRDSFIHSFDDAVTIKGIDRYADTNNENILIEHCILWCDWGKTCEIGIETACREYKKITFRDCDLLRAGNTALDIANGDCAEVSDILFEDIRVEYNRFDTPEVYQHTDDMVYTAQDQISVPHLIRFGNPRFRNPGNTALWGLPGELLAKIDLTGITSGAIHDVICRNIRVYYDEGIPMLPDGRYNVPIAIYSCMDGVTHSRIHVSGVTVNGTPITTDNAVLAVSETEDFTLTE